MVIQPPELAEWLNESSVRLASFNQAYKAFMPGFKGDVLKERRAVPVDHFINMDFTARPIVLAGVIRKFNHPGVTISGLYTFPEFRGQGYARFVVKQLQQQTHGYLQIAVEKSKLEKLSQFYEGLGFIRAKGYSKDPSGTRLYDFFWSRQGIAVYRDGDILSIRPRTNSDI